jgi:hypothetical protein
VSLQVAKPLVDILEKEWDATLFNSQKGVAPMLGWRLLYHTLRSKGSQSGFPDRVLVRDRIIYAELKREKGVVSDAQREWLDGLASAGAEVYLWKPSDLDEIGQILSKRWSYEHDLDGHGILVSPLATLRPRSMWLPGLGRPDESAGLADAAPP